MTEVENLMDLIHRLLVGSISPADFVIPYREQFADSRGSDPYELWAAFEDLAHAAANYVEEDELRDPEFDIDAATLLGAARATHDIASDIIRRRRLHNIR